ncbi:MAG: transposase [Bacteroidetes bacterium]|nr:transposase [Bacteroidota bacterium]
MHPKHVSIPASRYFITCRCAADRNPFAAPRNCVEYQTVLAEKMEQLDFSVIAYVLMPDHIHLLIEIGKCDPLQKIMHHVNGAAAFRINGIEGKRGVKVWQGRYYDSRVRAISDLINRINYIHMNPVRKGFSSKPSQYACSSASLYCEVFGSDMLGGDVLRGVIFEDYLSKVRSRILVALKGDLPS